MMEILDLCSVAIALARKSIFTKNFPAGSLRMYFLKDPAFQLRPYKS